MDGAAPEPWHPTPAGAASTGPPVPTGAATAVVAVYMVSVGVRCRGTYVGLARYLDCVTVVPVLGFSGHKQDIKYIFTACEPRVAIYLPELTAV